MTKEGTKETGSNKICNLGFVNSLIFLLVMVGFFSVKLFLDCVLSNLAKYVVCTRLYDILPYANSNVAII